MRYGEFANDVVARRKETRRQWRRRFRSMSPWHRVIHYQAGSITLDRVLLPVMEGTGFR